MPRDHPPCPPSCATVRWLRLFLSLLFAVAPGAHFRFATKNWRCWFLPGHESCQTRTALIAHAMTSPGHRPPATGEAALPKADRANLMV